MNIAQDFLERMVLSFSLDCHASLQGIQRFAESVLGQHLFIGKISGMIREAADRARQFDDSISLESIQQGANDEIFQCNSHGYIVMTMFEMQASHLFCIDVMYRRNFYQSMRKSFPAEEVEKLFPPSEIKETYRYEVQNEMTADFDDDKGTDNLICSDFR